MPRHLLIRTQMISAIHLLTSYVTLPSLLIIFKDDEPGNISTELFLYKLIVDKRVQDTFPNVAIALRMFLVLMVTNCSAERSFSKLKQIENRLRTSMTQGRL